MDISKKLAQISVEMQISFMLNDNPIPADEVFAAKGLLPAIMRRADQLCSFCLGHGLGVTFDDTSDARLGVQANFNDEVSTILRIMCATEILYELTESSPKRPIVVLDDLMFD